jgi:hypothetical protein
MWCATALVALFISYAAYDSTIDVLKAHVLKAQAVIIMYACPTQTRCVLHCVALLVTALQLHKHSGTVVLVVC